VLVLDGPGDVAEGPVADVPGEGAAHLAERQRPSLAVHVRDAQLGHVAEAAVRVGDEPPELPRIRQSAEQEGVVGLVAEGAEDLGVEEDLRGN
jgi:hypothetical protein